MPRYQSLLQRSSRLGAKPFTDKRDRTGTITLQRPTEEWVMKGVAATEEIDSAPAQPALRREPKAPVDSSPFVDDVKLGTRIANVFVDRQYTTEEEIQEYINEELMPESTSVYLPMIRRVLDPALDQESRRIILLNIGLTARISLLQNHITNQQTDIVRVDRRVSTTKAQYNHLKSTNPFGVEPSDISQIFISSNSVHFRGGLNMVSVFFKIRTEYGKKRKVRSASTSPTTSGRYWGDLLSLVILCLLRDREKFVNLSLGNDRSTRFPLVNISNEKTLDTLLDMALCLVKKVNTSEEQSFRSAFWQSIRNALKNRRRSMAEGRVRRDGQPKRFLNHYLSLIPAELLEEDFSGQELPLENNSSHKSAIRLDDMSSDDDDQMNANANAVYSAEEGEIRSSDEYE